MVTLLLLCFQVPCGDLALFHQQASQWPASQTVATLAHQVNLLFFDPLCPLGDEFDDSATLSQWHRLYVEEEWPGDQLEGWDIDQSRNGYMTLMPYTSSWYEDCRGIMVYREIDGDFIASTRVQSRNRAGTGAPGALYSLGGLFIRAPRDITAATWVPGGENYLFLSLGAASVPGRFQFEVKTTQDSVSVLEIDDVCPDEPGMNCTEIPEMVLRGARIGGHFILLRKFVGGSWEVHRRYPRSDMPFTLQVGVTSYTDWGTIDALYWPENVPAYNNTVITDGEPDLIAQFDYIRYQLPEVPDHLAGADFSAPYDPGNPDTVSDAELLSFLGFD